MSCQNSNPKAKFNAVKFKIEQKDFRLKVSSTCNNNLWTYGFKKRKEI